MVKLVRGDLDFHCTVRVRAIGWLVVPAVAVTARVTFPPGTTGIAFASATRAEEQEERH
jgi:hypothetical protein